MSNKKRRKTTAKPRPRPASAQQPESGRPWRKWAVTGGITVGVIALVALIIFNQPEDLQPPVGVEEFVVTDRGHVPGTIVYEQDPPIGGDHNPIWQECGVYRSPVNNENAVHALEHGAVWITYRPDLDQASIDQLEKFGRETEVLVSPYPGLDSPVVASTWTRQLRFDSATDPDIKSFVVNFKNGPGTPEPAAGCNDGRGTQVLRGQTADG